jgi:hypothetical protein
MIKIMFIGCLFLSHPVPIADGPMVKIENNLMGARVDGVENMARQIISAWRQL